MTEKPNMMQQLHEIKTDATSSVLSSIDMMSEAYRQVIAKLAEENMRLEDELRMLRTVPKAVTKTAGKKTKKKK